MAGLEEATFIVGISDVGIEYVLGSIPQDDMVEQETIFAGEIGEVMWRSTVVRVFGTRKQSIEVFNALTSGMDEPEFDDEQ